MTTALVARCGWQPCHRSASPSRPSVPSATRPRATVIIAQNGNTESRCRDAGRPGSQPFVGTRAFLRSRMMGLPSCVLHARARAVFVFLFGTAGIHPPAGQAPAGTAGRDVKGSLQVLQAQDTDGGRREGRLIPCAHAGGRGNALEGRPCSLPGADRRHACRFMPPAGPQAGAGNRPAGSRRGEGEATAGRGRRRRRKARRAEKCGLAGRTGPWRSARRSRLCRILRCHLPFGMAASPRPRRPPGRTKECREGLWTGSRASNRERRILARSPGPAERLNSASLPCRKKERILSMCLNG